MHTTLFDKLYVTQQTHSLAYAKTILWAYADHKKMYEFIQIATNLSKHKIVTNCRGSVFAEVFDTFQWK